MAVKKQNSTSMERFIDKGAAVKASKEKEFRNILVRIPADILHELDAYLILNKPWLNRTQWIVETINEKLKRNIP
jgi:hypothetical protein